MIFKMWVKSKFVLWKPRYNHLFAEKKGKKLYVSETLIFWKHTVPVNLKKFSSNTISRLYTWGKFYMVKLNYFSGRPNKVKERFWNILIEHYVGDIGNKNITVT